jgi:hypothetical protein
MKSIGVAVLFLLSTASLFAQTETVDLVTYTPPKDWAKEVRETGIAYTAVNEKNNTWCQIIVMKSMASKGSIEEDFESEWQDLIVRNYKPTESRELNEVVESDGWKIKAALVKFKFNNSDALAMLTTASGFQHCTSIVAVTNSQDFLKDVSALISSVVLKTMITESANVGDVPELPQTNNDASSVIGTWGLSLVVPYRPGTEGSAGSTIRQYTFYANGTFKFYTKIFSYSYKKLLLVREKGTYQISGNMITINPQSSVLEGWSKKDGTSDWGNLLSTENRPLEKISYQFTKHYYSGIQEWNLVLQASPQTKRDGPYANSSTFTNAWLYGPVNDNALIKLPN